ncbi:uncharacterized protein LOC117063070 [Trachypithecus francoisi]|uniref:uncharacterized protein LOC117063070 n=1 Tax=Trachypithecus francoisi TaxID=54180 RepID=UPI00141A7A78|nr:uncharacterized protein LOC117063070 [Trachypithecus francoisi]
MRTSRGACGGACPSPFLHLTHSSLHQALFRLQPQHLTWVPRGEVGRQCALECARAVPGARLAGVRRSRFQMLPPFSGKLGAGPPLGWCKLIQLQMQPSILP